MRGRRKEFNKVNAAIITKLELRSISVGNRRSGMHEYNQVNINGLCDCTCAGVRHKPSTLVECTSELVHQHMLSKMRHACNAERRTHCMEVHMSQVSKSVQVAMT